MEGSESEAIFESLDLNPQLFINEALNRVDELVDGAFDYFLQEASKVLEGDERSEELKKGISYVHHSVQSTLDKRLGMWEKYCLRHCFAVPPGLSLPSENETSGAGEIDLDDRSDELVDAELLKLWEKVTEDEKECAELKQELQELDRKSGISNQCVSSVNKVFQLYEQANAYDMFEEMLRVASELGKKTEQKSKQKKDSERDWREKASGTDVDLPDFNCSKGLSSLRLQKLDEVAAQMNL